MYISGIQPREICSIAKAADAVLQQAWNCCRQKLYEASQRPQRGVEHARKTLQDAKRHVQERKRSTAHQTTQIETSRAAEEDLLAQRVRALFAPPSPTKGSSQGPQQAIFCARQLFTRQHQEQQVLTGDALPGEDGA